MNLRRVSLIAALLVVALLTSAPAAAAPKWELLGVRNVTDRLDHDTIAVTAKEGKFTKLQVRVAGVAVQFRSMKVHYANGETQNVELKELIRAGKASRVIDLAGTDRVIERVEFVYDAQALRGRSATVRLFGRH